jgi:hypothetical protein
VYSFIVEAGSRRLPGFDANSVSPRVRDTIMAPQFPLRTRAFRNVPISDASESADVGVVKRSAGGAGLRVVGRRVGFRVAFRAAGRVPVALRPGAGTLAAADPPFWAAELAIGAASAAKSAPVARRRAPRIIECSRITMTDVATGVPGT